MPETAEVTLESIQEALRDVYDPEIPVNVYDLGLVYDIKVTEGQVYVQMTLTAPGCGMGEILGEDVREKVAIIPTVVAVDVEMVFDPPWNQDMMSEAAKLEVGLM